jgi:aminoglycoside phosphotransferase (APT) family kinase protein
MTVTVNTVTMDCDLNDRLLCVLRRMTGVASLDYVATPERLTGGFWADLLSFSLMNAPAEWSGELVARVMPDPSLAYKETVVQSAVALAGVPTPRVRGSGGPGCELGRAFMVMDRAEGVPLLAGLDSVAGLVGAPRRLARMPDLLASAMSRLHAVDPASVRDELASVEGTSRTIPEMLDHLYAWSSELKRDDLTAAAQWLAEHPIDAGEDVICHGDLHPFNVLITSDGEATLLDWSASVLAPRAYDVAFTSLVLSAPPIMVPRPVSPLVRGAGRGLARRFRTRYRRHSGERVEKEMLDWYQAVVCLRSLAEAGSWVADGTVDSRAGHPWLVSGPKFAAHLSTVTGAVIRPL